MHDFDLIIIGAGAAGLMCAVEANKRGRRVLIIDHAARAGQKIRISGGGRSNFTNLHASPANYLSDNPQFCFSALGRYSPQDFIHLVEKHGISYHQRDHGQLFCSGPAQQIIDMLLEEAHGVSVRTETNVINVYKAGDRFTVKTDRGQFTAVSLVIATGGPSFPKLGSSGFGYKIARQFGLKVIEPRPGLVPLVMDADTQVSLDGLAGISLNATVKLGKVNFTGALLFTHRGISGPVILQISSYWRKGDKITIDLLPGSDIFQHLKNSRSRYPRKEVRTEITRFLPKRLAQRMVELTDCNGCLAEVSDKNLRRLAGHINSWHVAPGGSQGYATAEVTVGGVDTRDLSSRTMQAESVPGLYFIGETVDVTGHLGGFNFQWAWASGHACGQVA